MSAAALRRLVRHLQRWLLPLLLGCYALAGLLPGPGIRLRSIGLGRLALGAAGTVPLGIPVLMLAFLVFSAGLGMRARDLAGVTRRPLWLGFGLSLNFAVPLAFALTVALLGNLWHSGVEIQTLLVGLALIGSMPIAASSTAWSLSIDANLALSLGLVLLSSLLGPVLTPAGLHLVGFMAEGDYAEDLHELAVRGSAGFLIVTVVLPSMLGLAVRVLLPDRVTASLHDVLKLATVVVLLMLNYSNAALALPQAFAHPDWDYLLLILAVTSALCGAAFLLGWRVPGLLGAAPPDRAALMFALGMNNNGTSLVLGSLALADHPRVMLPIIFYNLEQQIAAGVAVFLLGARG